MNDSLPVIMPAIASIIGAIFTIMLGMALNKLTNIETQLSLLNGKFFDHVTHQSIHEAGFARAEERIASIESTVKIAHDRIDSIKGKDYHG